MRNIRVAIACAVAIAVAAACGGGDSSGGGSSPHNDADVQFAQAMIPHHEQAIEMSELVRTRARRAEVKALAAGIEDAQGPEIELMEGFLSDWGDSGPGGMDHGGMDHGGMDHGGIKGMMSEAEMDELAGLEGKAFDVMFLDMMIHHHQGAVDMARDQLSSGKSPEAKRLAADIEASQEAEIAQMQKLLDELRAG